MKPALYFNKSTGQLRRVKAAPRNTATTGGVTADSGQPPTTPWGTAHTGRGTDVTSSLPRLHDMTPIERRKSIQRSRFIVNRTGLGRALVEGTTRYSVGGGITGYAATDDQEFDDAADRFCDAIFENRETFDIRGELDYYEMQEVVCPEMITDGDLGAAKILPRDNAGRPIGTPGLQLFTSDQIESGGYGYEPDGWLEGVKRDEYGRKLMFRVLQEAMPGQTSRMSRGPGRYVDFEARDFIHVLDPKRIGISRGIPWTHHGQASAITMMDLKTLEESAAYLNAFFGAVIETPDGKIPEGFEGHLFGTLGDTTTEVIEGTGEEATTTTQTKTETRRYLEMMGGSWIPVLKKGEELKFVASTRPSQTFTGFMDWLVNDIAWGFGVPPAYVWAIAGRTGPETRLTLSQADWFFQMVMRRMVSRFCKPVRDWIILWGLVTGRLNNGRPPRNGRSPYLARWHGPRKITIDEGREGKLEVERIKAGLGTEEEFYARRGQDADTQALRRITEISKRLKWCEDNQVPWQLYFGLQPGQTYDLPGAQPASPTPPGAN